MSPEQSWPVPVFARGPTPLSCGTVVFRSGPEAQLSVTVIVKACFSIAPEAAMEATTPSPLAVADAHYGESPRRSLRQASEVAPYLAKAEVLVAGHTFAPPGRPATSLVARLALLSAGQVVLDKALRILGDVDRAGHVLPFMHMPLVYERALFDADENPVGVVPRPGLGPNILLARSPERPGGFGPLAPRWPSRLRLAGGELPAAAADAVLALPGGFSWAHFQAAPRDQHIDFLRGDETLVLGSLHPALPLVRTRLPGVRAEALLLGQGATPRPIPLRADSLVIDTSAQTVSVLFRGHVAVPEASVASLARLRVVAGLGLSGAAIDLREAPSVLATPAPAAADGADDDDGVGSGTMLLPALPTGKKLPPPPAPPPPAPPPPSTDDEDGVGASTRYLPEASSGPVAPTLPFFPGQATPPAVPRLPHKIPVSDEEATLTLSASFQSEGEPTLPFGASPAPAPPGPSPVLWAPEPVAEEAGADDDEPDDENPSTLQLSPADAMRLVSAVALPFSGGAGGHTAGELPLRAPPGSPWAEVDPSLPAPAPFSDEDQEATQTLAFAAPSAKVPRSEGRAPPDRPLRPDDSIPVHASVPFVLVTMPWQVRPPRDSLTVIVKGTFALVADGPAALLEESDWPTGDVHVDDDPAAGLLYPSDFAIWKAKADVVVKGHAFAPGGSSPASEVVFRFGHAGRGFSRRLAVFGDRRWGTLAPTAPLPFTSIPLVHERAFGGPGFEENPVGRGYRGELGADGVARLPNLEDPAHLVNAPSDKPSPATLGPIAATWKERWSRLGHYDGRWLKTRWPYFPEDFDWGYFQAAPKTQQLPYLVGDEPFEVTGMHPLHPRLVGSLPGLRARCFTLKTDDAGGAFEEVILRLDSAVLDMDTLRLHLVWRGVIEVSDEDAPEIAAFYLMAEPLGRPASVTDARADLAARMAPQEDVPESPEGPSGAANDVTPEPPSAEEQAAIAASEAAFAALDASLAGADVEKPEGPLVVPPPNPEGTRAAMLGAGFSAEEADELVAEMAEPSPRARRRDLRAEVVARLAAREPLDGLELDGANLSGLDLSGQSLIRASLRRANLQDTLFRGAILSGALLAESELTGANLEEAECSEADFTGAVITRARFDGAVLSSADFSQASGEQARFVGAKGEGTLFADAALGGARFERCVLSGADFTRARLDGAVFTSAHLTAVLLYDAVGDKASFEEASLKDARGDGARLPRATFRKADATGSVWEKAHLDDGSFLGAKLSGASFVRASCQRVTFAGADLSEARLRRAKLAGASFFQANLLTAALDRADLRGADLRRANLHGAETWKADLTGADLDFALLTKTKLRGRS
jgi:uncharacterized protein YjbI with pentapeptide repeats